MNTIRKTVGVIAQLGIIVVIIFSLGCGRNTALPVTNVTPSASLDVKPVVMPVDDGGGVITFATYSFLADAYKPVLEEFHKQYPSITVQFRELSYTGDMRQIASTADTMLIIQPQKDSNYFLDLTSLMEQDPAFIELTSASLNDIHGGAAEPTGELDTATIRQILSLFRHLVEREGITVLLATHDPLIDEYADLVFTIQDGRLAAEVE